MDIEEYYIKASRLIYWRKGKPYNRLDRSSTSRKDQISGTVTKKGYRQISISIKGKERLLLGHRLRWYMRYGYIPEILDHIIPEEKDNNSISNLRPATDSQNQGNRRKTSSKYTSKYKGVYRNGNKSKNIWSALLSLVKGNRHLGTFSSEEQAAKAYNDAASLYFGEFALLNVINKKEPI